MDKNDTRTETSAAATGAAAARAHAQLPWDEAKQYLNPFEQKLATFINRRIGAQANVTVNVGGRKAAAVEYLPGGASLGRLKVETGAQAEPEVVDVDETTFETLLAKIINV